MRRYRYLLKNGRMDVRRISQSVQSWLAHVRFANSRGLVQTVLPHVRL